MNDNDIKQAWNDAFDEEYITFTDTIEISVPTACSPFQTICGESCDWLTLEGECIYFGGKLRKDGLLGSRYERHAECIVKVPITESSIDELKENTNGIE